MTDLQKQIQAEFDRVNGLLQFEELTEREQKDVEDQVRKYGIQRGVKVFLCS